MDNKQILKEIDKAVKNITDFDSMGDSVLAHSKFDQFVRQMQDEANILGQARYLPMDSFKVDIDRIAFMDRILHKGIEGEEVDGTEPTTYTNQLEANELKAILKLTDKTVRRNIERGNLENTLVDLLGEAAGRDMEEYALFASEDFDPTLYNSSEGWDAIDMTNAWIKLAEQKLWEASFNQGGDDYPEDLFEDMLSALPKKYLRNRGDWRFFVTWDIENAYRNLLKSRGTNLGDAIQIGHDDVYYKGIPVVYAPMLERYDEGVAMLQNPDNMVWGIFHEVTLESEREVKLGRTDFVLNMEGDAKYEDENAVVVAIDGAEGDGTESTGADHPLK